MARHQNQTPGFWRARQGSTPRPTNCERLLTKTCLPARSASRASSMNELTTGVATITASTSGSRDDVLEPLGGTRSRVANPHRGKAIRVEIAEHGRLRPGYLLKVSGEIRPSSRVRRPRNARTVTACRCSALAQHREGRTQEQANVEAERPRTRVGDVHLESFREGRVRPGSHLPHSRDPLREPGSARSGAARSSRSRTGCTVGGADQGHLATKHVQELWQFVEARASQEAAERRHCIVAAKLVRCRSPSSAVEVGHGPDELPVRPLVVPTRMVRSLRTVNRFPVLGRVASAGTARAPGSRA